MESEYGGLFLSRLQIEPPVDEEDAPGGAAGGGLTPRGLGGAGPQADGRAAVRRSPTPPRAGAAVAAAADGALAPRPAPGPERPGDAAAGGAARRAPAAGPARGGAAAGPPEDVDAHGAASAGRRFGDAGTWNQVTGEAVGGPRLDSDRGPARRDPLLFQVKVPKPYPGIQYRGSKSLDDKLEHFARHLSVVSGVVEDDGEWLRVAEREYLPMAVGSVQVMERFSVDAAAVEEHGDDGDPACCAYISPRPGGSLPPSPGSPLDATAERRAGLRAGSSSSGADGGVRTQSGGGRSLEGQFDAVANGEQDAFGTPLRTAARRRGATPPVGAAAAADVMPRSPLEASSGYFTDAAARRPSWGDPPPAGRRR